MIYFLLDRTNLPLIAQLNAIYSPELAVGEVEHLQLHLQRQLIPLTRWHLSVTQETEGTAINIYQQVIYKKGLFMERISAIPPVLVISQLRNLPSFTQTPLSFLCDSTFITLL